MYKWQRIKVLHTQGVGIRQIARDVGVSRNTVRKYLKEGSTPQFKASEYIKELATMFIYQCSVVKELIVGFVYCSITIIQGGSLMGDIFFGILKGITPTFRIHKMDGYQKMTITSSDGNDDKM